MDEDLLKTFVEIYKTRHFGKAAENLHITQSAASARIKLLENNLGVKLFVRNRKQLELTPAGQKLIVHAESMIASWNRLRVDVAIEDPEKLALTIGGIPSLWDIYIGRWIRRICKNNHHLALTCEALSHDILYRRLLEGSLDIAFTYEMNIEQQAIKIAKTIPIHFVMVSSKKNINAESAIKTDYIYVDWGTAFASSHANHFPELSTLSMHIGLGRIAKDYIRHNGGSAYLPEKMVKLDLEKYRLFKVEDAPVIKRNAYILYRQNNTHSETIASLIEKS